MKPDRRELFLIKCEEKCISAGEVEFIKSKKGLLRSPLSKLHAHSIMVTREIRVSPSLIVAFAWKTAQAPERRALYGWMLRETRLGLLPVARMDYHPSHKGLHIKLNCESELDLIGRDLVACKEFSLGLSSDLDPDKQADRFRFVVIFCEKTGIIIKGGGLL